MSMSAAFGGWCRSGGIGSARRLSEVDQGRRGVILGAG